MSLHDLIHDKEKAAETLREIALEVESGCLVITDVRIESSPMDMGIRTEGRRLTIQFISTGQHDDDLLEDLS
jgi:hypothetical protein